MRIWAFLLFVAVVQSAFAQAPKDLVKAEMLADVSAVQPGQPFRVGVLLKVAPKWHVYWKNPGDSGMPTQVDLTLPEGFKAEPTAFPVPEKFNQAGGYSVYGYDKELMLLTTVTPPADLKVGTEVVLKGKASWLVCEKLCFPGEADLELKLPVAEKATPSARATEIEQWSKRLPRPADARAKISITKSDSATNQQWSGTIKMSWDQPPKAVQWFPGPSEHVAVKDVRVVADGDQTTIQFKAEPIGNAKASPGAMESVVAYTMPDGTRSGVVVPVQFDRQ